MQVCIGDKLIGDGLYPYLVAEIGQNHNGDVYHATRLVSMAVKAGADAVKFQLRDAAKEYPAEILDAPHPRPEHAYGDTYRDHRAVLDLNAEDLQHIKERIAYNEWDIAMYATPCHVSCVAPLLELGIPAIKIASKDLHNLELIHEAAQANIPVILSTGMAREGMLRQAVDAVYQHHDQLIVLQCVSKYPCLPRHLQLRALPRIREEFGCLVGLSDHTVGIAAPGWAVQHGACMIEKHITTARCMRGTDHAMSLEQHGLELVVRDIRNAWEACQGDSWIVSDELTRDMRAKAGA